MTNGSRSISTCVVLCVIFGLLFYFWLQNPTLEVTQLRQVRVKSAYDRPGTLSTHPTRFDGNLTGESIPYWRPFDPTNLSPDHGRLLEKLFLSVSSSSQAEETDDAQIETILFFGDSNERGIVDDLCFKLGSWAKVVSSKNPPSSSELWHADPHVCEIELREPTRRKLRFVSFMSYGVLIEKDSQLWEKKTELDNGPWAVEERIELARVFVEKMRWRKIDLIGFNSNLWDLMYLHDTHLRLKTNYEFSLSSSTLDSYISRSLFALSQILTSFPDTPIYFRTLHPLHPGRKIDFFNSRRVVQLNQAAIEIVSRQNSLGREKGMEVRLLDIGRVLEGWPTMKGEEFNILKDKVHLSWNPGLWMYGEMVLDALERSRR
ncbi:uncharacterized protein JCM6883_000171 [Sporobolomyces salmoneus]|uniref:uncharacterized protein n=1 Tax=Sporobolomyces salmoneus TaxID=183962 RepID=UPI00316E24BE